FLLAVTAVRTGSAPSRREVPVGDELDHVPHARLRATAVGIAAGGISGLLGIGGGVLMVPAFTGWLHLDIKRAVATSLCCVGILAVPGTITHAALGNVNWRFAIPLSIGVIPGARLGASLAIASTERRLRLCVAIVLGTIAVLYGALEIVALV